MVDVARPTCLVLASGDPFAAPGAPQQPRDLSVVRDADVFCERLAALRPSVAVVSVPPASAVHVRWLRSKIELTPDAPVHLVTVRGVGYRLDPEPR